MITLRNITSILTIVASLISIGFGIWHFFVPDIWNWYSYINKEVTELIIAVQAINIFFSLLLVLLGLANILLITRKIQDKYSVVVVLSISAVLWITRIVLQIVYPQGSQNPAIQYGMLLVFVLVTVFYMVSLAGTIKQQTLT